ncbi:anti-sigma factor antagonist [Nonomuraea sp. SBT364]|uniref:anti-sigma factor antagonist n=1 Tax=Nonomuraea sp. SBT364 TaxID=1580530 RepID=UPI00066BF687|nr:anti-sigma factor antagonist [Nonomuraea sp. SBT364]
MTDDAFTLSTAEEHGVIVVRPVGELAWKSVAAWRSWLEAHLAADTPLPVLVDLAKLAFIDSSGISALVGAFQQAQRQGTAMAFAAPSPVVARWLLITGLHAYLPIFDTVEAALPAVLPPPAHS